MYMVEITENKLDELVENAEKMLKYGGKVMSCLEDMRRGERRRYERGMDYDDEGRYGERYGGGYYGGGRRY